MASTISFSVHHFVRRTVFGVIILGRKSGSCKVYAKLQLCNTIPASLYCFAIQYCKIYEKDFFILPTFILPIANNEIFTIDYTVQKNKLNKITKWLENTGNNKINKPRCWSAQLEHFILLNKIERFLMRDFYFYHSCCWKLWSGCCCVVVYG